MELPAKIVKELNKNADTSFRNIGPLLPIEICGHKWEWYSDEADCLRNEPHGGWVTEIYRCYRCGSESGIDYELAERLRNGWDGQ